MVSPGLKLMVCFSLGRKSGNKHVFGQHLYGDSSGKTSVPDCPFASGPVLPEERQCWPGNAKSIESGQNQGFTRHEYFDDGDQYVGRSRKSEKKDFLELLKFCLMPLGPKF